jgi:hypothetical protein
MTTTMRKGNHGWEAEDVLDFDGPYKLTIQTSKNVSRPGLLSRASVSKHANGMMTHSFGLGHGGDYSERLIMDPTKRCTEKSVAEQHAQAMARLPEVLAAARVHYEKFPIKAEA